MGLLENLTFVLQVALAARYDVLCVSECKVQTGAQLQLAVRASMAALGHPRRHVGTYIQSLRASDSVAALRAGGTGAPGHDTEAGGPLVGRADNAANTAAARAAHADRARPSGGVGFLVFNAALRVSLLRPRDAHLGMCTISISGAGRQPIAIIGLYNPPATSPLQGRASRAGSGDDWSTRLLAAARRELARLEGEGRYACVLVMGDLNMRVGPAADAMAAAGFAGPRVTADAEPQSGRRALMSAFLASSGLVPVHGCPGQAAGSLTSRAVAVAAGTERAGAAEVDYILAAPQHTRPPPTAGGAHTPPAEPLVVALPAAHDWAEWPDSLTHVPVAARVRLLPLPAGSTAALGDALVARAARRVRLDAPYCDTRTWYLAGEYVLPAIAAAVAAGRELSTDAQYAGLVRALQAATARVANERVAPAPLLLRAAAPHAASDPPAPPLPPDIVQAERDAERARAHLRRAMAALRAAKRAERTPGAVPTAPHVDALRAAAMAARRTRRRADRRLHTMLTRRLTAEVQRLALQHRSAMFASLSAVAPLADDVVAPEERIASVTAHRAHFASAFAEGRASVPALSADGVREWAPFMPRERTPGAGDRLMLPISPDEVHRAIFPVHASMRHSFVPCTAGCPMCDDFAQQLQRHAEEPARYPLPVWRPSAQTRRAAGPDGISHDTIRFARAPDAGATLAARREASAALAELFNRWLAGEVPASADAKHAHLTPLLKRAAPGVAFDADDPANSRGISVSGVLPKYFALVLAARVTHWAVNEGVVSPEQHGFMPMLSTEMPVLALLEALGIARQQGTWAAALFVDVKGAYDAVHVDALWHVLEQAGAPLPFVACLRAWYTGRSAAVRVGSCVSEAFDVTSGTAQGNPLSPILWNIFFEPLLRRLRAEGAPLRLAARPGTAAALLELLAQVYADDLAALAGAESLKLVIAAAQLNLTIVCLWAAAWGMRLNTKPNKTEVMLIPPAGKPAPDLRELPQLDAGPDPDNPGERLRVGWTDKYRYLGCVVPASLDVSGFIEKKVQLLHAAHRRYFLFNPVLRRLPHGTRTQLAGSLCLGVISYLIGVVPVHAGAIDRLESVLREVGRSIFDLPRNTDNRLVSALMPGLPLLPTVAAQALRVREAIRRLPPQYAGVPARRLLEWVERAKPSGASFLTRVAALVDSVASARGSSTDRAGVPRAILPAEPPARLDILATVTAFRQSGVFDMLMADKPEHALPPWPGDVQRRGDAVRRRETARAVLRPPAAPAADVVAALLGLGWRQRAIDLRVGRDTTELSAVSSATAGSPLRVASGPPQGARVARLWLGRTAYAFSPWQPPRNTAPPQAGAPATEALRKYYAVPDQCALCEAADRPDGPLHLMTECQHPDMRAGREETRRSAAELVAKLAELLVAAMVADRRPQEEREAAAAARRALLEATDGGLRDDADGRALLTRLLAVAPLPPLVCEFAASEGGWPPLPALAAFTTLLHITAVRERFLRKAANLWTHWAGEQVAAWARRRAAALGDAIWALPLLT